MNLEEYQRFYDENYQNNYLEVMELVICENCQNAYNYREFENGCCPNCGKLHPDYRPKMKICDECGERNRLRDKYCRYCGAQLGKGFKPYLNVNDCVYGPPAFAADFVCKSCGNKWSGNTKNLHCPKCGKDFLDKYITDDEEWYGNWGFTKEYFLKNGYK